MFARTRRRTPGALLVAAAGAITALAVLTAFAACAAAAPPAPTETATPSPTPTVTGPVSTTALRSVIDAPREHPELAVVGPAEPLAGETAQQVTYPSGGVTVAGVLRTPPGLTGPAPVAIVVHGAVDPAKYETGRDRTSEQRALLAAGFVVLAIDLRGFGASDAANVEDSLSVSPFGWPVVLDWGMALDVANALRLAADGRLPGVDPKRVALVGHSLGGLLAIDGALVEPGIPGIVIALNPAPVDLSFALEESGYLDATDAPTMSPADLEALEAGSAVPFLGRAQAPLLVVHGSADDVIPVAWSQHTVDVWNAAGPRADLVVIDGADHGLQPHLQEVAGIVVTAALAALG